ncbi:hypothetical protein [Modicisalibacter tunisiensis]|uniref:Cyd operon protein YbgE n=1 Tax=Modicisalibacter tunisiensis TaxID=390637 RepID=A0ABS7WZA3_9GAMM|nr:hypothetical protein [Modicisalibacter tunisiensis]MBZ9567958.1 hypothetical protein [Modicisalibacter tunisiensis]
MDRAMYRQLPRLLALGWATLMALVLLWHPEVIRGVEMPWRLPLWLLGVAALGIGFAHGAGLTAGRARGPRYLASRGCWVLLAVFSLLVLWRL